MTFLNALLCVWADNTIDKNRLEVMQVEWRKPGEHTEEYMTSLRLCPWLGWGFFWGEVVVYFFVGCFCLFGWFFTMIRTISSNLSG